MQRLIGLLLFLGGAVGAYFAIDSILWQHRAITAFVPVPAKVISSQIGIHRGSKGGASYSPDVTYSFTFEGRPYTSSRVLAVTEAASHAWASRVLHSFPMGARITAYANPQNPAESILWRVHSALPYVSAQFALMACLTGLFLLLGFLAGGRKTMLAIPLDADGRHLLMPTAELRKRRRNWALIWFAHTLLTVAVWGHFQRFAEERELWTWIVTAILGAIWLGLAIFWWRLWSISRHVSDARVIIHPAPMIRGQPLDIRVEMDAYSPLRVSALRASVVCVEHYREKAGSKTTYGTRINTEKSAQLLGPSTPASGQVISGHAQFTSGEAAPVSWLGPKKTYPYYTWEIRIHLDLASMPDYHGVFPLTVQ